MASAGSERPWRYKAAAWLCFGLIMGSASIGARAAATEPATAAPGEVSLTVGGQVQHPLRLTVSDLRKLPPITVDVSFKTGHGQVHAAFTGVSLWLLVERAGIAGEVGKDRHHLQHSVLVSGRDGYAVALSVGELDPRFEGKSVIIAYARDGQPIPENGIRLVVPGDQEGGRSVRDVVSVELK